MALRVVDRAIQVHGAEGISQDQPLAYFYASLRTLRFADVSLGLSSPVVHQKAKRELTHVPIRGRTRYISSNRVNKSSSAWACCVSGLWRCRARQDDWVMIRKKQNCNLPPRLVEWMDGC